MIQRSYSLGKTEGLANISESLRQLTKINTGMCSLLRNVLNVSTVSRSCDSNHDIKIK